jgi:glycosyltransferase involved in cell wall biosynthesis
MSLKIAMVGACPYPVPQGSQVFFRDNALALKSRGHDVHLVVYGFGLGSDHSGLHIHRGRRFPGDGRTDAGPSLIKPLLDLDLVFKLRATVDRYGIDVVYAHNYEALLVALLAGKRPIIYHAHNAMSDELPYYFRYKMIPERVGRWLDRTFPRRADRIVVPHRRLAGHLIVRGCDHTKITVVPPPVDADLFEPAKVGKETPSVLYTGNLDAYQNLGLLFAAMEHVRRRVKGARLVVATNQDADIPGAEIVKTMGFDALPRLLAQDSIFVVPRVSWSGYPVKLLNAMAAGKAIVACASAAYPITHEVSGLVVDDNDEKGFADAILRLMNDPKLRAEFGRNARTAVLQHNRPDQAAEQLEAVALRLLEQSQPLDAPA